MYVRCEKRGFRIDGTWVPKGGVKKVSKEVADTLKSSVSAGLVTLHTKDPAAKKVSARKSRSAPGLEALEKAVKEETKSE